MFRNLWLPASNLIGPLDRRPKICLVLSAVEDCHGNNMRMCEGELILDRKGCFNILLSSSSRLDTCLWERGNHCGKNAYDLAGLHSGSTVRAKQRCVQNYS